MKYFCFIFLLFSINVKAQSELVFTSVDSLLNYAERNSVVIKSANQQSLLAKWTKVAAMGNLVNLKSPLSFSVIDNTQLPVSFLPAEAFGGQPGNFKEVSLGQQYVTNLNIMPQIDIINLSVWQKLKSANINEELTLVNNQLSKRNLFESIAAAYFNCLSTKEQIKIVTLSLVNADSVVSIAQNKYKQGIIRQQEFNNALINRLTLIDKLNQLKVQSEQQKNTLKVLCDIPLNVSVEVEEIVSAKELESTAVGVNSQLLDKSSMLQASYLKSELRSNRLSLLPTLSLVFYQGWQQNSNAKIFDDAARWIPTQYVGIKLAVPFPPDVARLSQNYTSKINYKISELNREHQQLQNKASNISLGLDLEKASSSLITAREILALKGDNLKKSENQFLENILPTRDFLEAFNDKLNSELNFVNTSVNVYYVRTKIKINNTIK